MKLYSLFFKSNRNSYAGIGKLPKKQSLYTVTHTSFVFSKYQVVYIMLKCIT